MNDLASIRDHVISEAFSELMAEDIQIEYKKLEDALLDCGQLTSEGYYIEVDEVLQDAPQEVLEGGLAHEFAHLVVRKDENSSPKTMNWIAYRFCPRYRILNERNTDLEVIMRGYGHQLLAFLEYAECQGFPYYREDGLSAREIGRLLSL